MTPFRVSHFWKRHGEQPASPAGSSTDQVPFFFPLNLTVDRWLEFRCGFFSRAPAGFTWFYHSIANIWGLPSFAGLIKFSRFSLINPVVRASLADFYLVFSEICQVLRVLLNWQVA